MAQLVQIMTCVRSDPIRTFGGRHPQLAVGHSGQRAGPSARSLYGRLLNRFFYMSVRPLQGVRPLRAETFSDGYWGRPFGKVGLLQKMFSFVEDGGSTFLRSGGS